MNQPRNILNAEQRAALETTAGDELSRLARRAQIILAWDSGLEPQEIARQVRLAQRTVSQSIRAFEALGMDAFAQPPARKPRRPLSKRADAAASAGAPARITVEQLCREYDVDMKHASHVAELALQLLALTMPLHQLDERYLDVIYVAGLLHNIAFSAGVKKHHTRGRDILLNTPLSNISDADRALIATVTAFHRKAWSEERLGKEKSYVALPAAMQPVALWLAAVLRIADGLDYSQTQSTCLTESVISEETCLIGVKGPQDKIDRPRADQKADMWRAVTGIALRVGSRKDVRLALRRRVVQRPEPIPLSPTDPMGEAGRNLLRFHLQRMFYHEPGTRSGVNSESVHDMRVAVRRMTAALDVFGGAYKGKARRWMQRGLLALEGELGSVRDFDVNIAQAETYLETLPDEARPDLEQLIANWQAERDINQGKLLRTLDGRKYAEFADALLTFCETPGADIPVPAADPTAPIIVAHAAPAIIYIRYEALRAYEPLIQDAPVEMMHELRSEAKRMRYTLEFFRDVLGSEARDLIALFVRVQDHLGALQDADIASTLIQMYIKREVKKANKKAGDAGPVDVSTRLYGINAYLDSRQDQIETARKSFDPLWAEVISLETRQMIARAVGVL